MSGLKGLLAAFFGVVLALCGAVQGPAADQLTKAVALVKPASGSSVTGVVYFARVEQGVAVLAEITGLTPGVHGFHIHEYGDCSGPEAKTAGGHYNPQGVSHGCPPAWPIHVGDLGNLNADETGTATFYRIFHHLRLDGSDSILGRGVVVHAGEDDCVSQPSGAAGARVGCGTIGIRTPE